MGEKYGIVKCYHSHPVFEIKPGMKVYGGSCIDPAYKADCYVGLDRGMKLTALSFPWNGPMAVLYPITNMSVPKDPEQFAKLLVWMTRRLEDGLSLHLGCIGGHGRTGLVLSALTCAMTGDKSASHRVREEYCEKAVESQEQVDWLWKHLGIKKVKPRHGPPKKRPPIEPLPAKDPLPLPVSGDGQAGFWDDIEGGDDKYDWSQGGKE